MHLKYQFITNLNQYGRLFLLSLAIAGTIIAEPFTETRAELPERFRSIHEAEELLAARGYWISKIDNVIDPSTRHAIGAFQKVEGRKRTGRLTILELKAIRLSKRPKPSFLGTAHVEIDLKRQVLFLVSEDDLVTHILPVSTGSGKTYYQNGKKHIAYTPQGTFKITRQIKGIRRAPLGILYHPNYFYNGVAIHGSDSIPFYPASHGCVRIPRFAAKKFSDLVAVGMPVILYKTAKRPQLISSLLSNGGVQEINAPNIPCK